MAEENKEIKKVEKKEDANKDTKKVEAKTIKEENKKEENKGKQEEKRIESKEVKKETDKKFEPVKVNKEKTEKTKKEKVEKPKASKGIFTRAIAIIVILLAIIGLIYLAIPTPEKTVNSMFQNLKKGNIEEVNKYTNYEELSIAKELGIEGENGEFNQKEKKLFEKLEWKINSVNTESDKATIEIEVVNKDYETIFKNYIQTMFQKFLSNENPTEEEEMKYLLEEIEKDSIGTRTVVQTITATKVDGQWKVLVDENLTKALYPGLEEAVNSISNLVSFD